MKQKKLTEEQNIKDIKKFNSDYGITSTLTNIKIKNRVVGFKTFSDALKYQEENNLNKISMGYNKEQKFFIEYCEDDLK